jgi:hypothetical protein
VSTPWRGRVRGLAAGPIAAALALGLAATLAAGAAARPGDPARAAAAGTPPDSGIAAVGTDGAPGEPDSVVLVFPVRRSPLLLTLRASAPLSVSAALPPGAIASRDVERGLASPDDAPTSATPSLLRRDPLGGGGAAGSGFNERPGDRLVVSGSKSFSLEVGRRRDADFSQALDLTLRGRVAGDVDLAATLSDRALPFEPDGTTRELDDLEQLTLSLRAPGGEAMLGDFRLQEQPGEFARASRELQGVRGAATVGGARWDVTAAGAKGERRAAEFRGEEGKQGPYVLRTRDAASGGEGGIVAGSEAVWLDGARLKRGSDADYVMDYAAGTITFTVRRPISSSSRIAVDFEAAAADYKRQLYAAATRGGGARGSWFASFIREGDDWRSPYGAELSGEDRRALASAGDSAGAPLPSGVREVGPGLGSYLWDESDPAAPRWLYVGAGHGDYEVEFSDVGAGEGAYADTLAMDGTRFFRYVGPALGDFTPGRTLAVPTASVVVDAGGTFRLGSALSVDAEIARSSLDRNLLSGRDDGDNGGVALRGGIRLDPRPVSLFGRRLGAFRTGLSLRSRDDRFTPLDRLDGVFEGERWNQRSDAGGERRVEGTFQYDPARAMSIRGEWGARRLADGARSNRRAAEAEWRGLVAGLARWEEARNDGPGGRGLRSRWNVDVGRDAGLLQPKLRAGVERISGAEGDSLARRSSRFASSAIVVAPSAGVRLRGGITWRHDRESSAGAGSGAQGVTTQGAAPERSLRSTSVEGGATLRAEAITLDASLAHRRARGDGVPTGTDLAQVTLSGGRAGGPVTSELRWDVSQFREPERLRTLTPVGAGLGSYDASGTLAPGGGYEFVTTLGPEATRTRAAWQWRLDAFPGRASAAGRKRALWRAFGASTLLRLESDSRLPLGRLDRALRFGEYLDPASTLRGNWSGRQTLEFVPWGSRVDARLEAGARREVLGDLENLRVSRDARDVTLRTRHPLPRGFRLSERVTVDQSRSETARSDTPDRSRGRIHGRGAEAELTRAAGPQWNLGLLGRYRRDADAIRGGTQTTRSAGPVVRCAAGGRLRVDARALWGKTEQSGTYAPPGLVVAPVLGDRLDYDVLGELFLRERLQLTMTWAGAAVPGRASSYTARLELRSSF